MQPKRIIAITSTMPKAQIPLSDSRPPDSRDAPQVVQFDGISPCRISELLKPLRAGTPYRNGARHHETRPIVHLTSSDRLPVHTCAFFPGCAPKPPISDARLQVLGRFARRVHLPIQLAIFNDSLCADLEFVRAKPAEHCLALSLVRKYELPHDLRLQTGEVLHLQPCLECRFEPECLLCRFLALPVAFRRNAFGYHDEGNQKQRPPHHIHTSPPGY